MYQFTPIACAGTHLPSPELLKFMTAAVKQTWELYCVAAEVAKHFRSDFTCRLTSF
jgi:hypothetical protein